MLYPLVESSLPDDTLRAWQRFRAINRSYKETESSEQNDKKESTHRMDLDGLLLFLIDEIEGEERVSIATNCFTKYPSPKPGNAKHFGFKNRREFPQAPSASTLIATSEQNSISCIFCAGIHESEILIGADIAGKLMTGGFKLLTSGPAAIETKLGWTVFGKNGMREISDNSALLVTSMLNKEILVSDLWSLDSLGILDPSEKKNKQELQEEARDHFLSTVKVNEEGRFQVKSTWLNNHLPNIVKKRDIATTHKIFDPLGIACPVTLIPKLLLQHLWKVKLSWDQEVDSNSKLEFCKWLNDLKCLERLKIPRWLNCDLEIENVSLHFCDANKNINLPAPPLPRDRVEDASVFQITGIDYAGPIFFRELRQAI
ncbi:unnamed protein product [Larinioides sclopetarius]|uniref:Uncharacterized protein n=1 Tax=Larinioides sclopetarius TaxID=280406 RepID=A0AAV1Z6Z1_9ARAC